MVATGCGQDADGTDPGADAQPAATPVTVEGVGKVEGPVAIFLVAETESLALHQRVASVVERHVLLLGTRMAVPFAWDQIPWDQLPTTLFVAVDLASGARWPLEGVSSPVVLARDRLVAWDDESIRRLALDGQVEEVLFQSDLPFSEPFLSPNGRLIAFTTTGSSPQSTRSVVLIDLYSGEEVLGVQDGDTQIGELVRALELDPANLSLEIARWSTDGSALWVRAMVRGFPAVHAIVELDGTVHAYPSLEIRSANEQVFTFAFSPDLRYLVRGRLPEHGFSRWRLFAPGVPYLESLEIVDVGTGKELAEVTADEDTLVHLVGPVDGQVVFAKFPEDDQGVPVYVLDVATGSVVAEDDPDPWGDRRRAMFSEDHAEHNLAIFGRCFETRTDLKFCHETIKVLVAMAESNSQQSRTGQEVWRFIGFIWLD